MNTKMKVQITIDGGIDSHELHQDLSQYYASTFNVGDKTIVHVTIDIRESIIEDVLAICNKYGDCEVKAHMLTE